MFFYVFLKKFFASPKKFFSEKNFFLNFLTRKFKLLQKEPFYKDKIRGRTAARKGTANCFYGEPADGPAPIPISVTQPQPGPLVVGRKRLGLLDCPLETFPQVRPCPQGSHGRDWMPVRPFFRSRIGPPLSVHFTNGIAPYPTENRRIVFSIPWAFYFRQRSRFPSCCFVFPSRILHTPCQR